MKTKLLFASLLSAAFSFGQEAPTNKEQQEISQNKEYVGKYVLTLQLNLRGISRDTQGELKDEFSNFEDRMSAFEYDDINEKLTLKHGAQLTKAEVLDILSKFDIGESHVISYQ